MIYNDFSICHGSEELVGLSSTKGAITALTWSGSENMINESIGPPLCLLYLDHARFMRRRQPAKMETFGEKPLKGPPGEADVMAPAFLFHACQNSSKMSGQAPHPNGATIVQRVTRESGEAFIFQRRPDRIPVAQSFVIG